jgi:hypothetical protein
MIDAEDVQDWLENLDNYGMGDGYWIPSKESFEALCQLALDRLNRPEAVATVERHRRHVELSPGVGEDAQKYALAVCDDILADLQRPQSKPSEEQ